MKRADERFQKFAWINLTNGSGKISVLDMRCQLFESLKKSTAASVDLEIRLLTTSEEQEKFLSFIIWLVENYAEFDLAQCYLHIFLKCHLASIQNIDDMKELLAQLMSMEVSRVDCLTDKLRQALCFIEYVKSR